MQHEGPGAGTGPFISYRPESPVRGAGTPAARPRRYRFAARYASRSRRARSITSAGTISPRIWPANVSAV
jgi:hypothetical protein